MLLATSLVVQHKNRRIAVNAVASKRLKRQKTVIGGDFDNEGVYDRPLLLGTISQMPAFVLLSSSAISNIFGTFYTSTFSSY